VAESLSGHDGSCRLACDEVGCSGFESVVDDVVYILTHKSSSVFTGELAIHFVTVNVAVSNKMAIHFVTVNVSTFTVTKWIANSPVKTESFYVLRSLGVLLGVNEI